jgi:glycosyltransferase involved in cell wall biosynthesis
MNILWHSNAPWTPSGYGQQTRLFTPRIKAMGHELAISAYFGLELGVLGFEDIKIFPRKYDEYGNDIIISHASANRSQVIMTLMDVQVLKVEGWPFGTRWVPWYPIDHDTMPMVLRNKLAQAWKRIVFSKHAGQLTNEAGLDCYYVPHGVETNVFKPGDKAEAREKLGLPKDAYIIGTVAMNKGNPSRKSFVEMLHAFANCKKRHSDMVYYLQTATGEGVNWMVNLPELCYNLGLEIGKDVIFCDQYQQTVGFPTDHMPTVYQALDVHLLASTGEGFGIPTLEAQACGCPVIVGDWTASPELCFSGRLIPKEDADAIYTPLAAYQYRPKVRGIEIQLEAEYKNPSPADPAVKGAQMFDVDYVTDNYWKPAMQSIQEALDHEMA